MKTISEVAQLFGVSYRTIRNWIKKGKIKCIKIENTIRIPDEEIERLKNDNEQAK